jgi:lipopolysaccharide biosynthesis protein
VHNIVGTTPVTVFVHIYYPDIWHEMVAIINERLTLPFHLVLTACDARHFDVLPEAPCLLSVERILVKNRGRDIRPFLQALGERRDTDIGLKLHTKKSPQRTDGAQWRAAVLDSLLPKNNAEAVVAHFRADQRIGLVSPADFSLSVMPWVLFNAPGMIRVMSVLGVQLVESDLDDAYFAAGAMFWFRRSAIERLADERVLGLFEAEEGQEDGTIAHAIERLFPVEARHRGYMSVAVPALMSSHPSTSTEDLVATARRYADIPTIHFPGPGISAPPPPALELQAFGSSASAKLASGGSKSRVAGRRIIRRLFRSPL